MTASPSAARAKVRRAGPRLLVVSLLAIGLAALASSWLAPVKAASANLTFTITRVVAVQCDEGAGEACPNDFYARINVDAQGTYETAKWCNSCSVDFQPNWSLTRTVDTDTPIGVHVSLWDQDDLSDDDDIAISGGTRYFDITVNLNSCTWSGGGLRGDVNTQYSTAGTGLDAAKIYFTVNTDSAACRDTDGDGLLDGWETNGYDADGNGSIDVNLPAMGANPNRKDLYLEIDYLLAGNHTHAPRPTAIGDVVRGFANAPVANPDGTFGVQLHVDIGNVNGAGNVVSVNGASGVVGTWGDYGGGGSQIPEAGNTVIDWDGAPGNPGVSFFAVKNMATIRDSIFRYAIFAHQTNQRAAVNDCTSGVAKGIPGANFIVSLGGVRSITGGGTSACWTADVNGQSVGSRAEQAGTLMHEFGHTLGLLHGGVDSINNKPNYLSVMNYSFQSCGVPTSPTLFGTPAMPGGCDFSRIVLPDVGVSLDETSLDECKGFDNGFFNFGSADWNADKTLQGSTCVSPNTTNVSFNVNGDSNDANNNNVVDPGEPIIGQLPGANDWASVVYNHRTVFDFTVGGDPSQDEPDPDTLIRSRDFLSNLLRPELAVDKTGPTDAVPGQTLTYNLNVRNTGSGPALNVRLVDTKPDTSVQNFTLGGVVVGASIDNALTYGVACTVTDGTVLTNTVQMTGADIVGNVLTGSDGVSTTVHAPVLTMGLTATASVNAGEAVTYTVTYANTGSGGATNVVVTVVLPAGVYYSAALDQGAGPQPTTVTLNSDGTRTLRWTVATLAGNSGSRSIVFTARPTLLALGGASYEASASLSFSNGGGCSFTSLTASASTGITVVAATNDPLSAGYWKTHPEQITTELLARIQATDQRFDTTALVGELSLAEVATTFNTGTNMPAPLLQQLLATYVNLATRRVNAATVIQSRLDTRLGLGTVRDAALYAVSTLALPVNPASATRYSNATTVLDEINTDRSTP